MLGLAYGLGVDSTAVIMRWIELGIRPDFILFADVGAEKQATYDYLPYIQAKLKEANFPAVQVVRYEPRKAPYTSIEGNMAMNCTLPSPALGGHHSCTVKWKIAPQDKWCNSNLECLTEWSNRSKVVKAIGYEAGEEYRANRAHERPDDPKYDFWHPLLDWGWTREECIAKLIEAGWQVPEKSSCIFCPMMKEWEVRSLTAADRGRIMRIEIYAEPYNLKVHGLWGKPRKRDGRPGSITEFILNEGLTWTWPEDEMPMNPNCNKFTTGWTMKPPHIDKRLVDMIYEASGFTVPMQNMGEVENDSDDMMLF